MGTVLYSDFLYRKLPAGIKNNGVWFDGLSSRGILGWFVALALTGFYIALYFYPATLGYHSEGNTSLVAFFDPLSRMLNGNAATQWFVYGALYTLAILLFGIKFIMGTAYNCYQIIRTLSVMFFQLGFAFLIPELLALFHPDRLFRKDLKNMWPLNYYFFESGNQKHVEWWWFGTFMLFSGLAMIFVVSLF